MLNKNSFLVGILAAIISPALAWGVSWYLKNTDEIINKPALPYFVAIALNLIMLRFILKKDLDKTGKGLMLATFVAMIAIFIFKVHLR